MTRIKPKNFANPIMVGQNNYKAIDQDNGLQNLVAYYQSLFDREENIFHYSPDDYQNARRKYVKYLLKNRPI